MVKKNNEKAEIVEETKAKSVHRTDGEILTEKANRIGKILVRNISNLKKAQKNAINSDNIAKYNAMLDSFKNKLEALRIDETTVPTEQDEFDIDSMDIESTDENSEG